MHWRTIHLAVLLAAIVTSTACGRDSPTGPSRPTVPSSPFVGAWSGSIADAEDNAGALEVRITEHIAISLLGSWTARFADPARNDNGLLTGSVDGSMVRLTLQSTSRLCTPALIPGAGVPVITANLTVDGTRMTGSYVALACGTARDGQIELTRR